MGPVGNGSEDVDNGAVHYITEFKFRLKMRWSSYSTGVWEVEERQGNLESVIKSKLM